MGGCVNAGGMLACGHTGSCGRGEACAESLVSGGELADCECVRVLHLDEIRPVYGVSLVLDAGGGVVGRLCMAPE